MKYYTLTYSTNHKEIGPEYPQAGPGKEYNRKGPYAYPNVHHDEFPDFTPDLNYFELHKNAPLTDFVSSGLSHGFIVSQRIKDLMQDFKTVPHRFYPMRMKRGHEFFDHYYWVHIVSDLTDYIDFKKTKFFVEHFNKKERDLDISTNDELLEMIKIYIKENKFIKSPRIYLLAECLNLQLDLFLISRIDYNKYISEKLKERLIKEKVTGIEVQESKISF